MSCAHRWRVILLRSAVLSFRYYLIHFRWLAETKGLPLRTEELDSALENLLKGTLKLKHFVRVGDRSDHMATRKHPTEPQTNDMVWRPPNLPAAGRKQVIRRTIYMKRGGATNLRTSQLSMLTRKLT